MVDLNINANKSDSQNINELLLPDDIVFKILEYIDIDEKILIISKKYREKYLLILYRKKYKRVMNDINRVGLKILCMRSQLDIYKRPNNGILSLLCYTKHDLRLMFNSKDIKIALLMYSYV